MSELNHDSAKIRRAPDRRRWWLLTALMLAATAVAVAFALPAGAEDVTPYVGASADGSIVLGDWPAGSTVRVTVDNDTNAGNGVLASGDVVMSDGTWKYFEVLGGTSLKTVLQAGRYITAKRGTTTKVLQMVPLSITSVDPETNIVRGTGSPGTNVGVEVWNDLDADWGVQVVVDGTGQWLANLSPKHDLVPGDGGGAFVGDGDGDYTQADWRIPNPHVWVAVSSNTINVEDWPAASVVRVTLDADNDPTNGTLFSQDVTTESDGFGGCDSDEIEDRRGLHVGQYVTATQGVVTKTLQIVAMDVTSVDPASKTLRGTAPAGASIDAWADDEGWGETTADSAGKWSVRLDGGRIAAGNHGMAAAKDADGDATRADWIATSVTIKATPTSVKRGKSIKLSGSGKPAELAGETVKIQIKKPGKGWAALATAVLPKSGSWKYTYTVSKSAKRGVYSFRVVNARHGELMGSTSPTAKVTVR